MSEKLYLSPPGKFETEIPVFIVYEKSLDSPKIDGEVKGLLSSPSLSQKFEVILYRQGRGQTNGVSRYMGEISLANPGSYRIEVAGHSENFQVFKRADNLSFLGEFGIFFICTAITLSVVLCVGMLLRKKRKLKTV